MAQNYAEECRGLTHSSSVGRWTKRFGSCGENIFIASHKVPWQYAVKSWFSEKDLFSYGCGGNNLTEVRVREKTISPVDRPLAGGALHPDGVELQPQGGVRVRQVRGVRPAVGEVLRLHL